MSQDQRLLPPGFDDLEPFVASWALPTFNERMQYRAALPMAEIRRFYDVMQPRAEAAMSCLEQFPLNAMPPEAQNLFHLSLALAQAAMAVEIHGQPHVANARLPILVNVKQEPTPA